MAKKIKLVPRSKKPTEGELAAEPAALAAQKDVPVESHLPGLARNPKPKKVAVTIVADESVVSLEILRYHFMRLIERLAAELGGPHAQALIDLKADIAKRKS